MSVDPCILHMGYLFHHTVKNVQMLNVDLVAPPLMCSALFGGQDRCHGLGFSSGLLCFLGEMVVRVPVLCLSPDTGQ